MKTEFLEILEKFNSELDEITSTVLDELSNLGVTPDIVLTELDRMKNFILISSIMNRETVIDPLKVDESEELEEQQEVSTVN
jgi:hypothetical protein